MGGGTEPAALAPEMVVAILEVAQCFLHGWGCAKVSFWHRLTDTVEEGQGKRNERADLALFDPSLFSFRSVRSGSRKGSQLPSRRC